MAVIYVDMDNVLVDFKSGMRKLGLPDDAEKPDNTPGIFSAMDPMPGAVAGFNKLHEMGHEVYILSTAPWENPSAWSDKLEWVKKYLGDFAERKLILSHNKNLNQGDWLIDDRNDANGSEYWKEEKKLLHFGSHYEDGTIHEYRDWDAIIAFFQENE